MDPTFPIPHPQWEKGSCSWDTPTSAPPCRHLPPIPTRVPWCHVCSLELLCIRLVGGQDRTGEPDPVPTQWLRCGSPTHLGARTPRGVGDLGDRRLSREDFRGERRPPPRLPTPVQTSAQRRLKAPLCPAWHRGLCQLQPPGHAPPAPHCSRHGRPPPPQAPKQLFSRCGGSCWGGMMGGRQAAAVDTGRLPGVSPVPHSPVPLSSVRGSLQ